MRHRPRIGPPSARRIRTFHPWNHERSLGHRTDPARTDVRARLSARRREAHERDLAGWFKTRRGRATCTCNQSLKLRKRPLMEACDGQERFAMAPVNPAATGTRAAVAEGTEESPAHRSGAEAPPHHLP